MSEYLLINIFIITVPLAMSFENNIRFINKLKSVAVSIIIVSSLFILWDIAATKGGNWAFNPDYLLNYYLFGLPLEEYLFFLTVPYSMIFLFETAKFYLKNYSIQINLSAVNITTLLVLVLSFIFLDNDYTFAALFSVAVFLFIAVRLYPQMLESSIYWKFMAFSFIPFFIVNIILTALPVVEYSASAITGIRIYTVPVEDLFYSFSMISLYLFVYLFAENKWQRKKLE